MNSQLVLSRHSLLGRRISRHLQELHGGDSSRIEATELFLDGNS